LQELGYVEGRNIDIVYRYAEGDMLRMPALTDELVRLRPDVFVTATVAGTEMPFTSTLEPHPQATGAASNKRFALQAL
jgi:putative ABC transport system substrate-binding protein